MGNNSEWANAFASAAVLPRQPATYTTALAVSDAAAAGWEAT